MASVVRQGLNPTPTASGWLILPFSLLNALTLKSPGTGTREVGNYSYCNVLRNIPPSHALIPRWAPPTRPPWETNALLSGQSFGSNIQRPFSWISSRDCSPLSQFMKFMVEFFLLFPPQKDNDIRSGVDASQRLCHLYCLCFITTSPCIRVKDHGGKNSRTAYTLEETI